MQIKRAEPNEVNRVIQNMRLFDPSVLEEIVEPEIPMRMAVRRSSALWAAVVDDRAIALAGIYTQSVLDGNAYIWLVTTPEVENHQFIFARQTQIFIRNIAKDYRTINGHVDAKYERSIKWLKWLGFELGRLEIVGSRRLISFSMKGGQWTL